MLPFETIAALFPGVLRPVGDAPVQGLRPPALAHLAALEAFGCGLDAPGGVAPGRALVAAWLLTLPPDGAAEAAADARGAARAYARWEARARLRLALRGRLLDPAAVAKEVNAHLSAAFSTLVEAARPKDAGDARRLMRTGLGWPLELAEWHAHEYGRTLDESLREPLVRVLALVACARQRNGGRHGAPDYFERLELRARRGEMDALRAAQDAARKGAAAEVSDAGTAPDARKEAARG